jgi:hypothetical protein
MGIQIQVGDEIKGPFEVSEIQEMLAQGSVKPTDQAREEGKRKWAPLQVVVPELAAAASPEPKAVAGTWDAVQNQARQLVSQLRSSLGDGKALGGIVLVRMGAGLYLAIMILHLFALLYYLGFLPWHILCLIVQIAVAAPLFFNSTRNRFPFAVALILIVYLLGDAGRLGIQSAREYWGGGGMISRNANAAANNPRIQSLEREKLELEEQRYLMEERLELGLRAARLKLDGEEKQAKAVEEESYKLREKLSEEERNKLTARINLINAKVSYRRWADRHDAESLRKIETTSILIYIGIILAAYGAWNMREETS